MHQYVVTFSYRRQVEDKFEKLSHDRLQYKVTMDPQTYIYNQPNHVHTYTMIDRS